MLCTILLPVVGWLGIVAAVPSEFQSAFRVRNAPGLSDAETVRTLRRAVAEAVVERRDIEIKNTTTIEKSWQDAVLYQEEVTVDPAVNKGSASISTGVKVSCKTCYTKGAITAQVSVDGSFNVTEAFESAENEFIDSARNMTEQALQDIAEVAGDIIKDLAQHDFDIDTIGFPTLNYDFNMDDIQGIPDVRLEFQFDGLELYMELETALTAGATYTLNLYTSQSAVGLAIKDTLLLGVVFELDLILDAQAEIDISSGFHLLVDDGFQINIGLFESEFNGIDFPGGKFEFLPVTVTTPGAALKAVLRLGIHAGLTFESPTFPILSDKKISFGMGIEGSIFAHIAEFVTNITAPSLGSTDDECDLSVVEYYQFALGAAAGATINVGTHVWGPQPATTVPVYYTTLAEVCAITGVAEPSAVVSPRAKLDARDAEVAAREDLTTTTISTTVVFVGKSCMSSGMVNCPVSLQTTQTAETVVSLVTSVPSGETATFPTTAFSSVGSTVPFGNNVKSIASASGSPTSFVPGATGDAGDWADGETGGVSNKVIIGVSLGLGVPVLILIITACWCLWRRGTFARSPKSGTTVYVAARDNSDSSNGASRTDGKSGSTINVAQVS